MQSLTLVFRYLSFGVVPAAAAMLIGIAVLVVRQWWTVRLGARGLVMGDLVQGLVAYLIGTLLILGLLTWLLTNGHGFGAVDASFLTLPGSGSSDGPLHLFALVATGALGGWCWPDIFVRLFAANSTRTIKRAAVMGLADAAHLRLIAMPAGAGRVHPSACGRPSAPSHNGGTSPRTEALRAPFSTPVSTQRTRVAPYP